MKTKPLIYVAGPYSHPDPILNVRRAIQVGNWIESLGGLPYIPHLSMFQHLCAPRNYEQWIQLGLAWVQRCDAFIRIPGGSRGADREEALAFELKIPSFRCTLFDDRSPASGLLAWIKNWRPPKRTAGCSHVMEFNDCPYCVAIIQGRMDDARQKCAKAICKGCKAEWPVRRVTSLGWIHDIPEEETNCDPCSSEYVRLRSWTSCEAGAIRDLIKEKTGNES
jgi:hypothetical protein